MDNGSRCQLSAILQGELAFSLTFGMQPSCQRGQQSTGTFHGISTGTLLTGPSRIIGVRIIPNSIMLKCLSHIFYQLITLIFQVTLMCRKNVMNMIIITGICSFSVVKAHHMFPEEMAVHGPVRILIRDFWSFSYLDIRHLKSLTSSTFHIDE
ncbi:hypothetical protein D3C85_1214140 [compost metagenome]